MKIYPDLGKQRVEDRLAKIARRRMALALSQAQNATVMKEEKIKKRVEKKRKDDDVEGKKKRVKRQSKKKRLHIKGAQAG